MTLYQLFQRLKAWALESFAKPSDLTPFVTKMVNDLVYYYTKDETYTREEIEALVGGIQLVPVQELPVASQSTMGKIYLVPSEDPKVRNENDEFVTKREGTVGNYTYKWEQIGSTALDLSNYVTVSALNTALSDYTTTADLTALLSGKVDKETGKGLSTNDFTNEDKAKVDSALQSETDPTVPAWAKQPNKPSYTAQEVGALPADTPIPTALSELSEDTTHRVVTDVEKAAWNGKYEKPSTGIPPTDMTEAVQTSLGKADTALQQSDLEPIREVIPDAATTENKLADKAFVNSSIATATATFRGAYNLVTDLSLTTAATRAQIATALAGAVSTADNNDYAFVQVPTADVTPTEIARVERYKYNGSAWAFEYALNNSGFTASQWAALNSGITSGLVGKLSALPSNSELTTLLAGKQDTISDLSTIRTGAGLGATAYQKPASGIPASDMEAGAIPDAVEANPTVPSGTTPTDLTVLKVGNDYYGIPQPTVDNTPTANSANLVKSGGVYDAINPSVQSSQPQGGFLPNVVYDLGELTGSVTFALASPTDNTIPNAYHWTFDTGSTAPTITWPSGIIWPDGFTPSVDASMHYEVLVRNGYASMLSYSLS